MFEIADWQPYCFEDVVYLKMCKVKPMFHLVKVPCQVPSHYLVPFCSDTNDFGQSDTSLRTTRDLGNTLYSGSLSITKIVYRNLKECFWQNDDGQQKI